MKVLTCFTDKKIGNTLHCPNGIDRPIQSLFGSPCKRVSFWMPLRAINRICDSFQGRSKRTTGSVHVYGEKAINFSKVGIFGEDGRCYTKMVQVLGNVLIIISVRFRFSMVPWT